MFVQPKIGYVRAKTGRFNNSTIRLAPAGELFEALLINLFLLSICCGSFFYQLFNESSVSVMSHIGRARREMVRRLPVLCLVGNSPLFGGVGAWDSVPGYVTYYASHVGVNT